MSKHSRFIVWRRAHELALQVYAVSRSWPAEERFGLTSQTRRAAVSVVANIAEGAARRGPREFARFLNISLGSLAELETLLLLAADLRYSSAVDLQPIETARAEVGRMLWGLYEGSRRAS